MRFILFVMTFLCGIILYAQFPRSDYPALNDKGSGLYTPIDYQTKKNVLQSAAAVYYPDTIYIKFSNDSLRYSYFYNPSSNTMTELSQNFQNGIWVNVTLLTQTFTNNTKVWLNQQWANEKWNNTFRNTEIYDDAGNLTFQSMENYENGWHYLMAFTFTFENGLMKSWKREFWDNNQHVMVVLETYTYKNNYLQSFVIQQQVGTDWVNVNKGFWEVDDEGRPHEYYYYSWDNNSWKDSTRVKWYYNEAQLETLYVRENYSGSSFEFFLKNSSEYDSRGNKIKQSWHKWDLTWFKWLRFCWTYTEQDLMASEIYQLGLNDQWVNSYRDSITYNSSGLQVDQSLEFWIANSWIFDYKSHREYDANQNLSLFSFIKWNGNWEAGDGSIIIKDPWDNDFSYSGSKIIFKYKTLSDVKNNHNDLNFYVEENFPNPFNPSTTIRVALDQTINLQITIYDIQGKLVKTLHNKLTPAGVYDFSWDGTDNHQQPVSSGVYLCRVNNANKYVTRKMLLIR